MPSGDVVIGGGGIVGMVTAYYLAKAGVPGVVIERDAIGSHASGRVTGLRCEGGRVVGVILERDEVACSAVVLALGPWSASPGSRRRARPG